MLIRLSDVWDDMLGFARREGALVLPIALALFGLPQLLGLLVVPAAANPGTPDPRTIACMALVVVASFFGNLALAALMLRPGGSVGEAMATAWRRVPGAIGAVAVLLVLLVAATLPLGALLVLLGVSGVGSATPGPAAAAVTVAVMAAALAMAARLTTLWAWMVGEGQGGWRAVSGAFRQTRPVAWRMTLAVLLYMVTLLVVNWAVTVGLGTVGRAAGLILGAPGVGEAAVAVVAAALSATFGALSALFCAALYRRLAPAPLAGVFD